MAISQVAGEMDFEMGMKTSRASFLKGLVVAPFLAVGAVFGKGAKDAVSKKIAPQWLHDFGYPIACCGCDSCQNTFRQRYECLKIQEAETRLAAKLWAHVPGRGDMVSLYSERADSKLQIMVNLKAYLKYGC